MSRVSLIEAKNVRTSRDGSVLDVCELDKFHYVFSPALPELVFRAYDDPAGTWQSNAATYLACLRIVATQFGLDQSAFDLILEAYGGPEQRQVNRTHAVPGQWDRISGLSVDQSEVELTHPETSEVRVGYRFTLRQDQVLDGRGPWLDTPEYDAVIFNDQPDYRSTGGLRLGRMGDGIFEYMIGARLEHVGMDHPHDYIDTGMFTWESMAKAVEISGLEMQWIIEDHPVIEVKQAAAS